MEHWIRESRQILERSPTGALSLSDLKAELERAGIQVGSRERWLLTGLEARRELFRVVRGPTGPWRWDGNMGAELPSVEEPWIILQERTRGRYGPEEAILDQVREAVQAWGRFLADGSPSGVARWIRVNLEGASAFRALFRGPLRAE